MPDKRRHRGRHPSDDRLFAEMQHTALRTAVAEYSWLLTRSYAVDSALKLVGDRYNLTARQRTAVQRSACSDQSLRRRAAALAALDETAGQTISIDGYNLLITIESALSGGLILIGRDGCYRDLASVHGTYRKVHETIPALEIIIDYLTALDVPRIDWYLDKPVSNSGRLKAVMADVVEARMEREGRQTVGLKLPPGALGCRPKPADRTLWNIELVQSPDAVLVDHPGPVVTSDSVILDRCRTWINLAADIISACTSCAWIVDLRLESRATGSE